MITTTGTSITFNGNDIATQFSANFKADDPINVFVILVQANNKQTVLIRNSDYELKNIGAPQGFLCNYPLNPKFSPLPTGEKLIIKRVVPEVQNTDYTFLAKYSPKILERSLDDIVKMIQQMETNLSMGFVRTVLQLSPDATGDISFTTDSVPEGTKNKYISPALLQEIKDNTSEIHSNDLDIAKNASNIQKNADDIKLKAPELGNATQSWVNTNFYKRGHIDKVVRSAYFVDEKPHGKGGGTSLANTWVTRTINKMKWNDIVGASLSNNEITLPIGTFIIKAEVPSWSINQAKARIVDSSTGSVITTGGLIQSVTSGGVLNINHVIYKVKITAITTYRIEQITLNARADGLGLPSTIPADTSPETYTTVLINQIA